MDTSAWGINPQAATKVGLTLAQRRDDSTDVGPTLAQPTLLSGSGLIAVLYVFEHKTQYLLIHAPYISALWYFDILVKNISS